MKIVGQFQRPVTLLFRGRAARRHFGYAVGETVLGGTEDTVDKVTRRARKGRRRIDRSARRAERKLSRFWNRGRLRVRRLRKRATKQIDRVADRAS